MTRKFADVYGYPHIYYNLVSNIRQIVASIAGFDNPKLGFCELFWSIFDTCPRERLH